MAVSYTHLDVYKRQSIYWPDLDPDPVITLNTPFGITSCTNLANSRTEREVSLDGLNTVQQPAARTGASFHAAIRNGKFQGTIDVYKRQAVDGVLYIML